MRDLGTMFGDSAVLGVMDEFNRIFILRNSGGQETPGSAGVTGSSSPPLSAHPGNPDQTWTSEEKKPLLESFAESVVYCGLVSVGLCLVEFLSLLTEG